MDVQTLAAAIAVAKRLNNTEQYVSEAVSEYLSEHVDPETGYVLDDTLLIEGAAADAKAAGDKIASLKSAIDTVETKVGGFSDNLHDSSSDVAGKYWGADYTEESGSNWKHSALIDIGEYDKVKWTGGSAASSGKYNYFVSEDGTQYQAFAMAASKEVNIPEWAKYVTFSFGKTNVMSIYGVYTGTINTQISDILNNDIPKINELTNGYRLLTELSSFQIGMYTQSDNSIHTSTTIACSSGAIIFAEDAVLIAGIGYSMDVKASSNQGSTYSWNDDTCAFYVKKGQYIKLNVTAIPSATVTDAEAVAANVKVYGVINPTSPYALQRESFYGIEMYNTVGFIGDSYTAKRSTYNNCWAEILCKKTGITGTIYAHSGYTTSTWIEHILPTLMADTAKDLYWLALGINDAGRVKSTPEYLGSESDLSGSYEDYPDTFWGNYGRIIESIKAHAPNAKIVIATVIFKNMFTAQVSTNSTNIPPVNEAIIGLAEHYEIPCIDIREDVFYRSPDFQDNMQATAYTHPDPILFPGMANANARLFSKAVANNPAYFKTSTAPDPDE